MKYPTTVTRVLCALLAAVLLTGILPTTGLAAANEQEVLQSQDLLYNDRSGHVDYYYDDQGRLVREEWKESGLVTNITYYADGTPSTRKTTMNGIPVESIQYDKQGNPLQILSYSDKGKLQQTFQFNNTYDSSGRLVSTSKESTVGDTTYCFLSSWSYAEGISKFRQKGETFFFGAYEQDGDASTKDPIEWLVLDTDGSKVLAISVRGLDSRRYHNSNTNVSWKSSDIRRWLNEDFYRAAFTKDEQAAIQKTTLEDCSSSLFLLSLTELNTYFSYNYQRLCHASDYAVQRNAYVNTKTDGSWWLLRSPGNTSQHVMSVNSDGTIDTKGGQAASDRGVVRPAMWIDLAHAEQSILRFYSTTEYTLQYGLRGIKCKERYAYDQFGGLEQYYVEKSSSYTRSYDYTNTYHLGQLISAECVCTDYDNDAKTTRTILYTYDNAGRKIRELQLYEGGDGYTDLSWEYDDQGRLVKYSDQYRAFETNHYGPLSEALWRG